MARFDLTDAEWAVLEPLLPTDVRGKEPVDGRGLIQVQATTQETRATAAR
mgnify:CR=1 FL=1